MWVIKEGDTWLQRFKYGRLETSMLCWVFSHGLHRRKSVAYQLTLKMVMDKENRLDSSVSSLITWKAEPSQVSQSVGEERNKSGF